MREGKIHAHGYYRINLISALCLFGIAYFLSLFFRTVNAVLAPTLIADLGLHAPSLGLLTAAYFFGLGLMQIPVGLCLDAYGPRRVQAVLLLIAATGIGMFAYFDRVFVLTIARLFIGIGLAGCLMASFHAAALWLPSERIPLVNGFYLAAGGLGALAATGPIDVAMQFMNWRTLFTAIAVTTIVIAFAIAFTSPDPPFREPIPWSQRIRGLAIVVRNKDFRCYLPLTAVCFGTGTAMQGLWAAAWFRDVAGYDTDAIAWSLTTMAVALTVGSAAGGAVSLMLERAGFHLRHVVQGSTALFILSEIGILLSPIDPAIFFWLLFALTYNTITLSYALVARSLPVTFVGRSNTCMNTGVILSTFIIQYAIGLLLSLATGEAPTGHPSAAYTLVFAILVIIQLAALGTCILQRRRVAEYF